MAPKFRVISPCDFTSLNPVILSFLRILEIIFIFAPFKKNNHFFLNITNRADLSKEKEGTESVVTRANVHCKTYSARQKEYAPPYFQSPSIRRSNNQSWPVPKRLSLCISLLRWLLILASFNIHFINLGHYDFRSCNCWYIMARRRSKAQGLLLFHLGAFSVQSFTWKLIFQGHVSDIQFGIGAT